MPVEPGSTIAGYPVIELLGTGGMGEVYLVENPQLGRREAMKVVSVAGSSNPDFGQRFTNEARTAASLDHPSIITIYAHGIDDDRPWFTMAYIDGADLAHIRLTPAELGVVLDQVGGALDYAAGRGVVHRDIKPGNIVVTRNADGAVDRATLLDFGIAKLADSPQLTAANSVVGTVAFTAPEVISGEHADARSDQYSLACTMYQMLSGTPPFTAPTSTGVMMAHIQKPAPSLADVNPALAPLAPVLLRAMAKNPAERFPDNRAFAAEFNRALGRTQPAATTMIAPTPVPQPHSGAHSGPQSAPHSGPHSGPYGAPQQSGAQHSNPQHSGPQYPGPQHSGPQHSGPNQTDWQQYSGPQAAPAAAYGQPSGPSNFPPGPPPQYAMGGPGGVPEKKSKRGLWIAIAAIVAVLAVVGGTAPLWWPKGGEAAEPTIAHPELKMATIGLNRCVIVDEQLYCAGTNSSGQLADGGTNDRYTFAAVNGLGAVQAVSIGGYYDDNGRIFRTTVCAVSDGRLFCWGSNSAGEVGDGTKANRQAPYEVPGLDNVTAAVTDWGTTCAIARNAGDATDSLYCWGFNSRGQVGTGSDEQFLPTPTKVNLPGQVISVNSRGGTVCAIVEDGKDEDGGDLYCWGDNYSGQLGNGTSTEARTPSKVGSLSAVTSVSIGNTGSDGDDGKTVYRLNTCATTADGKAHCWGDGVGNTADTTMPVEVAGIAGAVQISTAVSTACVVNAAGEVYCWGNNGYGQVGNGEIENTVTAPVPVTGLENAVAVTTGRSSTCALTEDDQYYCWGSVNRSGKLDKQSTPELITVG